MADPRETILARLPALAVELGIFAEVQRNPANVDDMDMPSLAIWDGEETRYTGDDGEVLRPSTAFALVEMVVPLYVKVKGSSAAVGTTLNALRLAVFDAILTDTTLAAATLNGRGIRYVGCTSDPNYGESTIGQMSLQFSFLYRLVPSA